MKTEDRITLQAACASLQMDLSLALEFAEFGLYSTILLDDGLAIDGSDFVTLKDIFRWHRALGVNKEGIDVILNLQKQIALMEGQATERELELKKLRTALAVHNSPQIDILIEVAD